MHNHVYLVGAGPGDPGLITVRGLELLKKADCVIYDRLVAPELLDYVPGDCECIYAGKADSFHVLSQDKINELMAEKALQYGCVVRLKGGDPYVFGRGGEEGLYLSGLGIPFTIVPGVTSAVAGAAYAGIPVTHRTTAQAFRVITAHDRKGLSAAMDFTSMTDTRETLIFLMGLGKIEEIVKGLLEAGRPAETCAAVISHGTTPRQKVCTGNLGNIASLVRKHNLTSPGMIVVGDVVELRKQLNFYEKSPLFGKKYLVPKIGKETSRLAGRLRGQGAYVRECEAGEIKRIPARYTKKELKTVDLLLFTSRNGVSCFIQNLFDSGLDVRALGETGIAAIGPKTVEKLMEYGLFADFVPTKSEGETLARELKEYLEKSGEKKGPMRRLSVWYPTAKSVSDELADSLLKFCDCGQLSVYENVPKDPGDLGDLQDYDGIFFTSGSLARRLFSGKTKEELKELAENTKIYSIGPKCTRTLKQLGAVPVTEASCHTYEGMIHLLDRGQTGEVSGDVCECDR